MSYNATHGGKGDCPRPVDHAKYRANYDLIFKKHEHKTQHPTADDFKPKRTTCKTVGKDSKADRRFASGTSGFF